MNESRLIHRGSVVTVDGRLPPLLEWFVVSWWLKDPNAYEGKPLPSSGRPSRHHIVELYDGHEWRNNIQVPFEKLHPTGRVWIDMPENQWLASAGMAAIQTIYARLERMQVEINALKEVVGIGRLK